MKTKSPIVEERAIEVAQYIIDNNATVRMAAKQFGISRTTVLKDVTERLKDPMLIEQVKQVLSQNKSERHMRGGLATKQKYLNLNNS